MSDARAAEQVTYTVPEAEAGHTLAKVVRACCPGIPWSRARGLCETGRVWLNASVARDPARRLKAGDQIEVRGDAPRERRGVLDGDAIAYLDRDLVIVHKPVGMLSVPFDARDRDTLVDVTRARLRRMDAGGSVELGVVQRLDKETSGLLVFARTLAAKRNLQQQWRVHAIERRYEALVHGVPRDATHETWLLRDRGDGLRGSFGRFRRAHGEPPRDARRAVTHVRLLSELRGASLVECRLETGRQHQIRIHLAEAGHPLLGERVYVRDHSGESLPAPRVMLHARVLGFAHPRTGKPVRFEQAPPEDFSACLRGLSRR